MIATGPGSAFSDLDTPVRLRRQYRINKITKQNSMEIDNYCAVSVESGASANAREGG